MNGDAEVGRRSGLNKASKGRMQVSLLDDTVVAFDVEPKSKSDHLYQKVNNHLNLEEAEYFGLQYFDNEGNMCWLDPMKPIGKHVKEPSKVTFKFRVMFYSPDPNGLLEYTKYLFTLQVRRDLLDGRLYCSEDTGALLASYIVQGELGDYDPLAHREGYLSGFQFVSNQTPDVEEKIIEYHKAHRGQNPSEADHNMLEVARQLEMYGITLFPAKDSDDADLSLSVYNMGILVFQDQHKINMFSWGKIRKLSFKKKTFVIKLHPEVYQHELVEFIMQSRNACKGFWKFCIAHHTFFRQKAAQIPSRKSTILTRGSKFRYSGRTQKQILEESRETYRPSVDNDRSNRSARLSKHNEYSPLSTPTKTSTSPTSPTTPPPTFSSFNSENIESTQQYSTSTPSKKSEMSEDEGSFLLGQDSRKTSEQQLESSTLMNDLDEQISSCEEHKVIKICHQDTAEHTDEEVGIKAENIVEIESAVNGFEEELIQEETLPQKELRIPNENDREIEDQVNSIIERISREYELGKSGWQYRLTTDTDDKPHEVIPEEQRNGISNGDVNRNRNDDDDNNEEEQTDTFQINVKGLSSDQQQLTTQEVPAN